VRSKVVVDALEAVELGLQVVQSGGGGLSCEPALQGLVEAFDLALGLRVVGMAVLLGDAQAGEQVLEAVAAAGEMRSVDRPVVGEGRLRKGGRPWSTMTTHLRGESDPRPGATSRPSETGPGSCRKPLACS
jgi:hypothetical protein